MSDAADNGDYIAYQGEPGAFSELACLTYAPGLTPLPCATFEDAFEAVRTGRVKKAMLPIENSLAGRVADIHHLLPDAGLHIIAEYFLPVEHHLMARPGVTLDQVKIVRSHAMALGQCRRFIKDHALKPEMAGDTAGAARQLAEQGHGDEAVIASAHAAKQYGLDVLAANIEDEPHNTTRFLEMSLEPEDADPDAGAVVTSFVFEVRNIPAALYKAMGGFATNGVNMTKLESYQLGGAFTATMFYADIEGHPAHEPVRLALEELSFFSSSLKILGVYEAARER
ncbi:prephenate dehydratase [Hyphococcus sp.]|uniref:prephenate dehydratase n=1 Tax=Hyphococcus sp. TaxID=2038636 RepID=UPI003CCBC710